MAEAEADAGLAAGCLFFFLVTSSGGRIYSDSKSPYGALFYHAPTAQICSVFEHFLLAVQHIKMPLCINVNYASIFIMVIDTTTQTGSDVSGSAAWFLLVAGRDIFTGHWRWTFRSALSRFEEYNLQVRPYLSLLPRRRIIGLAFG